MYLYLTRQGYQVTILTTRSGKDHFTRAGIRTRFLISSLRGRCRHPLQGFCRFASGCRDFFHYGGRAVIRLCRSADRFARVSGRYGVAEIPLPELCFQRLI